MKQIATFILVLFFLDGFSQTFQISGTVRDAQSKETLVGVNVLIGAGKGTITNQEGKYFFPNLQAGNYKITFKYLGYETIEKTIQLTVNREFNVFLKPKETALKQIVVSAGRYEQDVREVTVSMEVLKPSLISNNNSIDFDDAINRVSGVNILKGQANIRGSSGFSYGAGSRVLVLVDNLPLLSADASDIKWSYIPQENIAQIEVIKGASSALFGSAAMGGIINIRTAYPTDKPQTKISTFAQIYDKPNKEHFNSYEGDAPVSFGLNVSHSQQIKRLDLTLGMNSVYDEAYRLGEYQKRIRFNANTRYRFKKKGLTAGINFNSMIDSSGVFLFWENDTLALQPDSGTNTRQLSYRFNVDPFISFVNKNNKHSLQTRIFQNKFVGTTSESNATLYYTEYQYQRRFNWKFASKSILTTGLVNTHNKIESPNLYGNRRSNNSAAFIQFDQKIKRFSYSLGFRYERFTIEEDTAITYPVFRTGINYQLAKATFFRASFGQGFRTPSIAERYTQTSAGAINIVPNPELQAESGWSAEIGIKQGWKIGKLKGLADVAAFRMKYEDMIEFQFGIFDGILGFKAKNIGKTQISGLEFSLSGKGDFKVVKPLFSVGYTYINPIDSTYEAQPGDPEELKYLKYRSKHLLRADVGLEIKKFLLGANIRYNSFMLNIDPQFNTLIDGVETYRNHHDKGNLIVDVRLNYQLTEKFKIAAICKNIANESYTPIPGNLGDPRHFVLQLSTKF